MTYEDGAASTSLISLLPTLKYGEHLKFHVIHTHDALAKRVRVLTSSIAALKSYSLPMTSRGVMSKY